MFCFYSSRDHPYLHVLTLSFPPRRSSDLGVHRGVELAERALDLGLIAGFEHILARLESVADLLACCEHSASAGNHQRDDFLRSEEHTSELQSLMRISYAVFCLKKKNIERGIILHPLMPLSILYKQH